jgi:aquaporin Z
MTSQPGGLAPPSEPDRQDAVRHAAVALRSIGQPNSVASEFDFWEDKYEGRRLFSELLGTLFPCPGGRRRHGQRPVRGQCSPLWGEGGGPGADGGRHHLVHGDGLRRAPEPGGERGLRGTRRLPVLRVPAYIAAQFVGAALATLVLWAFLGKQGSAGLTLPGSGISTTAALLWEMVLTAGLVSVILGTASGAQQIGPLAAIGVGAYIALAGLWGSPVSGASMNPARSLGPALVKGDWTSWWAYLAGPVAGAVIAVGIAYVLRGRGGGRSGASAAQGTIGVDWRLGPRPRP